MREWPLFVFVLAPTLMGLTALSWLPEGGLALIITTVKRWLRPNDEALRKGAF
jgi:hypothetical protein